MPEIIVSTAGGDYPILIRHGALESIGNVAAETCRGRTAFVVTDKTVATLYLEKTRKSLEAAGFKVSDYAFVPGEQSKTAQTLLEIYDRFHQAGISRSDPVIALGGGVVGDLAGFAAATYLRGLPLIHVPTTLLAQVDSSIGGKTGIDLPFGKNLAGCFYQPRAVIMDPGCLKSLSHGRMAEGMAEVVKYGLIRDLSLFEQIEQKTFDLEWILERCARIKAEFVARDEKDTGERMLLNFGHTVGHALEKVTGYSEFTHGEAVAVGMIAAIAVGEKQKITPSGIRQRVSRVLGQYHLPLAAKAATEEIIAAIQSDKKRLAGRIHFVLLRDIGQAQIVPMRPEDLDQVLREVWPDV